MQTYDFSPLFRYSVGFDRLEQLLDGAVRRAHQAPTYPPCNIETIDDDAYRISMAVAGFGKEDLEITQTENTLLISGKGRNAGNGSSYLHRGIANRAFERRFDLADYVKVSDASIENGMLIIDLEREVPEALKPRQIEITNGPAASLEDKTSKYQRTEDKKAA